MSDRALRVGILTAPLIEEYRVEAIRSVVDKTNVEVRLIVIDGRGENQQQSDHQDRSIFNHISQKYSSFREHRGWSLISFERRAMRRLFGNPEFYKYHNLRRVEDEPLFSKAQLEYCQPIEVNNDWVELPSDIVQSFKEDTDLIIRFGFGLITGNILTATKYGVLSFHPADIRKYRGLGPSIMFLNGEEHITITLQRLTDQIDGGEVVLFSSTPFDGRTYEELMTRIAKLKIEMLPKGVDKIQTEEFEPYRLDKLGQYYPVSTRKRFRFAAKFLVRDMYGHIRKYVKGSRSTSDEDICEHN